VPQQVASRAGLELQRGAVSGRANYQVWYRLPDTSAGFQVRVDSGEPHPAAGSPGPDVLHLEIEGAADGELELVQFSGGPQLMGVVVESQQPGVVLDTLGINGARVATPLAWSEAGWAPIVKARAPELVVLAYGTNEVVASEDPKRYEGQFEAVLERIRRVAPQFDCLLVGPTDVGQSSGGSHPRVAQIDDLERRTAARLGCRYFSVFDAMGGEGGNARWAEERPPLAQGDHVHLTQAGYEKLGERIATLVLGACR
jgi:lysophospholipase L1-like esterase